jgi:hypothetical protein
MKRMLQIPRKQRKLRWDGNVGDRAENEHSSADGANSRDVTVSAYDSPMNLNPLSVWSWFHPVVGAVLLVTAVLKTYHAVVQPMDSTAQAAAYALIVAESVWGMWLVIGEPNILAWRITVAGFTALAGVSAIKAWGGATSCGCFGVIDVSPWFTLTFDLGVLAALFTTPRGASKIPASLPTSREFVAGGIVATGLIVAATFGQSRFVRAEGNHELGKLVVLDPSRWLGKPFYPINEVNIEGNLSQGAWEVLLFRHDCDLCHDVMRQIECAPQQINLSKTALVAIGGLQSDGLIDRLSERGCKVGYLSQNREWFATTPLRISVRDGICVEASVIEQWDM